MAVINMERKWLFLFEPHTASRWTKRALTSIKFSEIGHHHIDIPELTNWRRQHIPKHRILDFKVMATIRNPFDVLVTKWRFGPLRDKSFREFFEERKETPEVMTPLKGLYKQASTIFYYEHLQSDLDYVFGGMLNLPDRNTAETTEGKKPWQEYYRGEFGMVRHLMDTWQSFLSISGYDIGYVGGELNCSIHQAARQRWTKPVV
jgi:hypothetical protein